MVTSVKTATERIPVILDTDIGGDIDDTWALALALRSPELDVRMVVTDTGDTTYRAKIAARMLEVAARTDVPVGIGLRLGDEMGPQAQWVEGYDLSRYAGTIHADGVGAMIETIMNSSEPVTLVCIGPVPNIAAALDREPAIAERVRFVGMHGSIRRGYAGSLEIAAEYNVASYPKECQRALSAPWDVTITPLDTCGLVALSGDNYRAVRASADPLTKAVIENYDTWAHSFKWASGLDTMSRSSALFDTVAVYLAFANDLLVMERLGITVTDDGYTVVDEGAKELTCATAWRDLAAFEDLVAQRLAGSPQRRARTADERSPET